MMDKKQFTIQASGNLKQDPSGTTGSSWIIDHTRVSLTKTPYRTIMRDVVHRGKYPSCTLHQ